MIKPVILAAAIVPSFIILAYGICKTRGSFRSEATWNALSSVPLAPSRR